MKKLAMRIFAVLLCISMCAISAYGAEYLIPVGQIIGLELSDSTVTVAAFDDKLGAKAKAAGLCTGDKILAIDGKATQLVTHSQMKRVMKVMEAAFESARTGNAVQTNI